MTQSKQMNIASHLTQMAKIQPYKRAVVFPSGRDDDLSLIHISEPTRPY